MDTQHLEEALAQHQGRQGQVIGCFAAASNVTGTLVDDVKVTQLLHRYGALAFWDYATAGEWTSHVLCSIFCFFLLVTQYFHINKKVLFRIVKSKESTFI